MNGKLGCLLEIARAGEDNEPGPQSISTIANMRFNALINDTGIVTKTASARPR
jgi:hypothetical protein